MQETKRLRFDPCVWKIPWWMATHSSILAWRLPWTEEPGRLRWIGSQRVRQNWSNLARMHTFIECTTSRASHNVIIRGQYRVLVVTKVPLCCGMLIMEEAMQVCGWKYMGSLFTFLFCCEPETIIKKTNLKKLTWHWHARNHFGKWMITNCFCYLARCNSSRPTEKPAYKTAS